MSASVHTLNLGGPFPDSASAHEAPRAPSSERAKWNLVRTMRVPLAAVVGFLALTAPALLARMPELPRHLHRHREAVLSTLAQPRPHLENGVPSEAEALEALEGQTFPPGHPALVAFRNGYGVLRVNGDAFMVVQLGPNGEVLHAFQAGTNLRHAQGFLGLALDEEPISGDPTLAAK